MLSIRRVGRISTAAARVRGNATLQSSPSGSVEPTVHPPAAPAQGEAPKPASVELSPRPATPSKADPAASETPAEDANDSSKGKRRVWPTKRPSITLERPRQYSRPIGIGALPVYDEALAYIKKDSKVRKEELERYKVSLDNALKEENSDPAEVERLKEKVRILEIQSEINLPGVRWKAKNGLADLTKTVYRHLIEQRWREEGALDLLMERIHQMNVVPDLLSSLHPSLDLRVNFPERPPENVYLRTRVKRKYEKVEPGIFLLPEQTRKQPTLYTTVFHTDTRLYTLLMVDLDVPDPENETFQTYLHWMQPNIALSALSANPIALTTTQTRYVPPHPQRGMKYHRYVILLLPQSNPTERISIPVPTESERLGFNFRSFAEKYRLDGSTGGGAHMWREVWDETVSKIYQDVLKTEEPVFGKMPKPDRYAEVKQTKKYI